jgi:hypothetical protein
MTMLAVKVLALRRLKVGTGYTIEDEHTTSLSERDGVL